MTMITILTREQAYGFQTDEWGRDDSGDVHVYDGDATLATFDGGAFVGAIQDVDADTHAEIAAEHARTDADVEPPAN